jgi:Tol biopolymer transport system component
LRRIFIHDMKRIDHRILFILAGLAALLVLAGWLSRFSTLPSPAVDLPVEGIGPRGPLVLHFSVPMQPESVESRLELDPPAPGRFLWSGDMRNVSFLPQYPLDAAQVYTLRLAAGSRAQGGRGLAEDESWPIPVRQAAVIYLSPSQGSELWRASLDGKPPVKLTTTGGKIYDFAVSLDGNHIAYSVQNEQKGFDLWEIERPGSRAEYSRAEYSRAEDNQARLLLPCQTDWCTSPAYAPDGSRILYARRQAGENSAAGPEAPRLWVLDLPGLTTAALFQDTTIGGYDPAWSPDGHYLAFIDGLSNEIRVLDLQAKVDFSVPSEMGVTGAWSPDSRHLLTVNIELSGEQAYITVEAVDVQTQAVRRVLGDAGQPREYSVPAWSPDGRWLAIAIRPVSGAMGKQLWLVRPDGSNSILITGDPLMNHASYHWDPSGQKIVFQRVQLGSSDAKPEVVVWDQKTGEIITLAEDAFLPQWVP